MANIIGGLTHSEIISALEAAVRNSFGKDINFSSTGADSKKVLGKASCPFTGERCDVVMLDYAVVIKNWSSPNSFALNYETILDYRKGRNNVDPSIKTETVGTGELRKKAYAVEHLAANLSYAKGDDLASQVRILHERKMGGRFLPYLRQHMQPIRIGSDNTLSVRPSERLDSLMAECRWGENELNNVEHATGQIFLKGFRSGYGLGFVTHYRPMTGSLATFNMRSVLRGANREVEYFDDENANRVCTFLNVTVPRVPYFQVVNPIGSEVNLDTVYIVEAAPKAVVMADFTRSRVIALNSLSDFARLAESEDAQDYLLNTLLQHASKLVIVFDPTVKTDRNTMSDLTAAKLQLTLEEVLPEIKVETLIAIGKSIDDHILDAFQCAKQWDRDGRAMVAKLYGSNAAFGLREISDYVDYEGSKRQRWIADFLRHDNVTTKVPKSAMLQASTELKAAKGMDWPLLDQMASYAESLNNPTLVAKSENIPLLDVTDASAVQLPKTVTAGRPFYLRDISGTGTGKSTETARILIEAKRGACKKSDLHKLFAQNNVLYTVARYQNVPADLVMADDVVTVVRGRTDRTWFVTESSSGILTFKDSRELGEDETVLKTVEANCPNYEQYLAAGQKSKDVRAGSRYCNQACPQRHSCAYQAQRKQLVEGKFSPILVTALANREHVLRAVNRSLTPKQKLENKHSRFIFIDDDLNMESDVNLFNINDLAAVNLSQSEVAENASPTERAKFILDTALRVAQRMQHGLQRLSVRNRNLDMKEALACWSFPHINRLPYEVVATLCHSWKMGSSQQPVGQRKLYVRQGAKPPKAAVRRVVLDFMNSEHGRMLTDDLIEGLTQRMRRGSNMKHWDMGDMYDEEVHGAWRKQYMVLVDGSEALVKTLNDPLSSMTARGEGKLPPQINTARSLEKLRTAAGLNRDVYLSMNTSMIRLLSSYVAAECHFVDNDSCHLRGVDFNAIEAELTQKGIESGPYLHLLKALVMPNYSSLASSSIKLNRVSIERTIKMETGSANRFFQAEEFVSSKVELQMAVAKNCYSSYAQNMVGVLQLSSDEPWNTWRIYGRKPDLMYRRINASGKPTIYRINRKVPSTPAAQAMMAQQALTAIRAMGGNAPASMKLATFTSKANKDNCISTHGQGDGVKAPIVCQFFGDEVGANSLYAQNVNTILAVDQKDMNITAANIFAGSDSLNDVHVMEHQDADGETRSVWYTDDMSNIYKRAIQTGQAFGRLRSNRRDDTTFIITQDVIASPDRFNIIDIALPEDGGDAEQIGTEVVKLLEAEQAVKFFELDTLGSSGWCLQLSKFSRAGKDWLAANLGYYLKEKNSKWGAKFTAEDVKEALREAIAYYAPAQVSELSFAQLVAVGEIEPQAVAALLQQLRNGPEHSRASEFALGDDVARVSSDEVAPQPLPGTCPGRLRQPLGQFSGPFGSAAISDPLSEMTESEDSAYTPLRGELSDQTGLQPNFRAPGFPLIYKGASTPRPSMPPSPQSRDGVECVWQDSLDTTIGINRNKQSWSSHTDRPMTTFQMQQYCSAAWRYWLALRWLWLFLTRLCIQSSFYGRSSISAHSSMIGRRYSSSMLNWNLNVSKLTWIIFAYPLYLLRTLRATKTQTFNGLSA